MTSETLVVCCGWVIGTVFGVLGQRSGFCVAGGFREWRQERRPQRAAALLLALSVALIGTQLLIWTERVPFAASIYYPATFSWPLVFIGGLLFGYGMMLARGCGARALVLLGTGNLRSFVVLICLGLAAAITLTGPLASVRLWAAEKWTIAGADSGGDVPGWLQMRLGIGAGGVAAVRVVAGLLLAGAALAGMRLHRHPWQAVGALGIGALIPFSWWVTGVWGADDFEPVPVESLTFVAPVSDSILYLMLSTGLSAGFGVAVMGGVVVGAATAALAAREFGWQGFQSTGEMGRLMLGGALMGVGGACAMGCSIGQGLTGLATLAFPSLWAVAGIVLGAHIKLTLSPDYDAVPPE
jgi:uncharacterized protein